MASKGQASGPIVIARGITTLDEARYFSAMGASWLGFDGSRLSLDEIRTMTEWVVGPRNFIDLDTDDPNLIRQISGIPSIHGVYVSQHVSVPDWYDGVVISESMRKVGGYSIIPLSAFDPLNHGGEYYWIECTDTNEFLSARHADVGGIVITCNPDINQEEVFEKYDQVFEALENL